MQICRILFISAVASSFVFSSQDVLLEGVVVSASGISTKKTELSKSELKKVKFSPSEISCETKLA